MGLSSHTHQPIYIPLCFFYIAISLVTRQSVNDNRTAEGFRYKTDNIDIYSNSWGPSDNGYTTKNLAIVETRALSEGANKV